MKLLNTWLNKVDQFFAYISAFTIFLMMSWIFLDVILRFAFHYPITGTLEFTGEYLMVIIVYFAVSYTQKNEGHVSVDLLDGFLSEKIKKVLRVMTNVLGLVVFVILGLNNFSQGLEYFTNDIRSASLLKYPLWPALMIISLGILLLAIRLVVDSINIVLGKDGPERPLHGEAQSTQES